MRQHTFGMAHTVIAPPGIRCQVCWRRRWFRCEVLRVYPTSLLVAYLDWAEAEWPHFFLRICLPAGAHEAPLPGDELWRVRWHKTRALSQLPVVEPFFSALPAILWLRAVLRAYALSTEKPMLQEVHDRLPKAAAAAVAKRHVVVVLGDSSVGKTKLIETLCAGPPDADELGAIEVATAAAAVGGGGEGGGGGGGGGGARHERSWPTVAPKCYHTEVAMPHGVAPVQLEVRRDAMRDAMHDPMHDATYDPMHDPNTRYKYTSRCGIPPAASASSRWRFPSIGARTRSCSSLM